MAPEDLGGLVAATVALEDDDARVSRKKLPPRVGSSAVVTCLSACPGASLRCNWARSAPLGPARHTASSRRPSGVMSARDAPRNSVYGPTRAGRLDGTGGTPVMVSAAGGVTTPRPCCNDPGAEQADIKPAMAATATSHVARPPSPRHRPKVLNFITPPARPAFPATRSTPPASRRRWRSRLARHAWSCGARGSPRRQPARRRAFLPAAPGRAACPA